MNAKHAMVNVYQEDYRLLDDLVRRINQRGAKMCRARVVHEALVSLKKKLDHRDRQADAKPE